MSLPLLIALLAVFFFILLTISSAIQEQRLKRRIKALEEAEKHRQFEEKLITEIEDALDYSPDIKKIFSIITNHLPHQFTYTTTSTIIVKEHALDFNIHTVETIPRSYIEQVKEAMLQSLTTLEKPSLRELPIHETVSGDVLHQAEHTAPVYVIHFPLMLHNSVAGLLTITSSSVHHFPEKRVASLQRVITQTSRMISKIDAAIQVEKGRLAAMIDSLSDGIFMIDPHNRLLFINPAAKHLLSVHKDNIQTMDVLSALPIHFDFGSKLRHAMHDKKTSEIKGVVLRGKMLRCTVFPVHDTTGKALGASVIMRDETLTSSVPRMKEDFTNIIVHELRSPLTTIKASSELLMKRPEFSKLEQDKLMQLIFMQSNKLLDDVNQILDAAKLESGVFELNKRQADLKKLLSDVTNRFTAEAQEKMINLGVTIENALPSFAFDSHYINLALTNVIANSMKFTGAGGNIQIHVKQKHDQVIITITDTGAGIPKDKQHSVFNKFTQLAEASARVGKGLGLYVVKGVIEAHGGTVDIDSDTGRGTTITLSIPLLEATHHPISLPKTSNNQHKMVN